MLFQRVKILLSVLLLVCYGCSRSRCHIAIIPEPAFVKPLDGEFRLSPLSRVSVNDSQLNFSAQEIYKSLGAPDTTVLEDCKSDINLRIIDDQSMSSESYRFKSNKGHVSIEANSPKGIFYGTQSLIQLLRENRDTTNNSFIMPNLLIKDQPRFGYRGMHLDVAKNFRSVQEVKRYIDLLAMYKYNTFHWHLVDSRGWRIEIKKYPLLTQKTVYRYQPTWKEFWQSNRQYGNNGETDLIGGYYTQKQIKDIVEYASKKYINIIPELEIPARLEQISDVYPNLVNSHKLLHNTRAFANNNDVFDFISDVLDEVFKLFPASYIHIGGYCTYKHTWDSYFPPSRSQIKPGNLTSINQLQNYFVKRIAQMVDQKRHKAIGWDEVLDGDISNNVTIMSYMGEKSAFDAARLGHDVIMTPAQYCYFDAYQANPETQPNAASGYLPLEKVYDYNPISKNIGQKYIKNILGVEGCLWTKYIVSDKHLEEMVLPRMIALSEVAWSSQRNRDWRDFKRRLQYHFNILNEKCYNYYHPGYEITSVRKVNQKKQEIIIKFHTEQYAPVIRYTLDGTVPTNKSNIYKDSLILKGTHCLKAAIFTNGMAKDPMFMENVNYHMGIGKQVIYNTKWNEAYPAGGESTLVDGYRGSITYGDVSYGDGIWQGFTNDMDVTIDLGKIETIHHVAASFMQLINPEIFLPPYIEIYKSNDGKNYKEAAILNNNISMNKEGLILKNFIINMRNQKARYVRIFAKNRKGFIFTDEIEIN